MRRRPDRRSGEEPAASFRPPPELEKEEDSNECNCCKDDNDVNNYNEECVNCCCENICKEDEEIEENEIDQSIYDSNKELRNSCFKKKRNYNVSRVVSVKSELNEDEERKEDISQYILQNNTNLSKIHSKRSISQIIKKTNETLQTEKLVNIQ